MKFIATGLIGFLLLVIALILRFSLPGNAELVKWFAVFGLLLIIFAILWYAWHAWYDGDLSPKAAPVRPAVPREVSRVDSPGVRADKLEASCVALEKVAEGLRSRISELQSLVDASGVRSENESLQDLLTRERNEKRSAVQSAENSKQDAIIAREETSRITKELEVAQGDLQAKDEAIRVLRAQLRQSEEKLNGFLKAEADRLGEIVPAGLLDSSVGERVRWCFEHAAKGDRLAAQILAALQSIKAAQDDVQLKGLLLSSLQVLGQSLSRLLEREQLTPSKKCELFNEWSTALNDLSASRFTITVPSIGARINLNTMVSSGSDDGSVTNVNCWGIRNEKGDLAYLAEIS